MFPSIDTNPTIDALARCRQTVLARASQVLDSDTLQAGPQRPEKLQDLVALLMTSLEELKVAEEELREQNDRLRSQRVAIDERLRHYHMLYLHAPEPSIVTDLYASILELNYAAAELFRREAQYLERKPLASLVAPESRDAFRRQLLHFPVDDATRQWPLVLRRMGDVPVTVRATVRRVPDLGTTRSGILYWVLEPQPVGTEGQP
ncbi:MAG TPA: PAS domain-containing protein [Gemmatimonadaceae bacterium]|nr:PAS domain-containing protein [Gemmatimonadaceae bacterium]